MDLGVAFCVSLILPQIAQKILELQAPKEADRLFVVIRLRTESRRVWKKHNRKFSTGQSGWGNQIISPPSIKNPRHLSSKPH